MNLILSRKYTSRRSQNSAIHAQATKYCPVLHITQYTCPEVLYACSRAAIARQPLIADPQTHISVESAARDACNARTSNRSFSLISLDCSSADAEDIPPRRKGVVANFEKINPNRKPELLYKVLYLFARGGGGPGVGNFLCFW